MIFLYGTPPQLEILLCTAPEMSIFCGRRWGKNYAIRNRIILNATKPNDITCFSSPVYAQCRKEYNSIIYHTVAQRLIRKMELQPFPKIIWKTGAETHYRTLNKIDHLRGDKYTELIIDESQNVSESSFETVLRPTVADSFGTIILLGQFRGHDWRYKNFYLPGIDPAITWSRAWRFSSADGICFQCPEGRDFLARQKSKTPAIIWEQEWECIPSANASSIFRSGDIDAALVEGRWTRFSTGGKYIIGLDIGKIVDPCAIVVLDVKTNTVVFAETLELGTKHTDAAAHVAEIAGRFKNPTVIMDSTGNSVSGTHTRDEFTRLYSGQIKNLRPLVWTQSNKSSMVNQLSLGLENKKLKIDSECKKLIAELKGYEFRRRSNGSYEYTAPVGQHDDLVAALLMAWFAAGRGWVSAGAGMINI